MPPSPPLVSFLFESRQQPPQLRLQDDENRLEVFDSAVAASDMNRGEAAATLLCLQMGAGANALALPARRIAVADNKIRMVR